MWSREELIEIMKKRGTSQEDATVKVDRCLAQIKKEPVLELMYLHDMLGIHFEDIKVDDKYVETRYC